MLQTMRARFDELYKRIQEGGYDTCTTNGPWNDSEYMALDAFMGTEATSLDEDTVINAYINWKEQAQ
jgi:hypothetical protein